MFEEKDITKLTTNELKNYRNKVSGEFSSKEARVKELSTILVEIDSELTKRYLK